MLNNFQSLIFETAARLLILGAFHDTTLFLRIILELYTIDRSVLGKQMSVLQSLS